MMETKTTSPALLDGERFIRMMRGGYGMLCAHTEEVNRLNVFPVPDGDTGDNMRMTLEGGLRALENGPATLPEAAAAFARGALFGARGNSGVILSRFLHGLCMALRTETAGYDTLAGALRAGVDEAYHAVMAPAEGTILTVAREGVTAALAVPGTDADIADLFSRLAEAARASLLRTPDLLPVLRENGVVDSGGAGLCYLLEGCSRVLRGEDIDAKIPSFSDLATHAPASVPSGAEIVMTYGYCTELLLQLQGSGAAAFDIAALTAFLTGVGDSVVAFREENIVKVHVHTLHPEEVLAFCHPFGEFLSVKIENMSVQHTETQAVPPARTCGIVAVCDGAGIAGAYTELGADEIVAGGQSCNPSVHDFLAAFEKLHAACILVLPNNPNVILTARQAAGLWAGEVRVLESRNEGEGYAALAAAALCDDGAGADERADAMREALASCRTGRVCRADKDACLGGQEIHEGDYLRLSGKEIVAVCPTRAQAAGDMLAELSGSGAGVVTVFCGRHVPEEESDACEAAARAAHPDTEFYFIRGGQEVYAYIAVAE